jgi:membrane protease YdiL (CAAX protease family)
LPSFFILAFVLTWLIQIPLVLDSLGLMPFQVPGIFQVLQGPMPGVAAIIIAAIASGKAGMRDLLRRVLRWRVGARWYALALFGSAALWVIAAVLTVPLGGKMPGFPALSPMLLVGILIQLLVYLVFNWEDIAWRGFALPRMQARQSALAASVTLGIIEALFHIPLFFSPTTSQSGQSFIWFIVFSIGAVIVYNWMFNNAKGSVLPVMLLHAAQNTWTGVIPPAPGDATPYTIASVLYAVVAIIIVVVYGPSRLSRKPASELPVVVDPLPAVSDRPQS